MVLWYTNQPVAHITSWRSCNLEKYRKTTIWVILRTIFIACIKSKDYLKDKKMNAISQAHLKEVAFETFLCQSQTLLHLMFITKERFNLFFFFFFFFFNVFGHLRGSVNRASDSWFQLRSWSQGCGIKPCIRFCTEHEACLKFSFSLPSSQLTCSLSL